MVGWPAWMIGARRGVRLSVIVVVHKMADQAERTLQSLSPPYQTGVTADDYEIIVVENLSDQPLGAARALQAAPNARYFGVNETRRTPVPAVNFGVAQARGPALALVIDGARMATPGVLRLTLAALRADPNAVISVPGYHLGQELQQISVNKGHDAAADAALLAGIGWPRDGYRLFEVSVLSGSCRKGFFRPQAESNFLAVSAERWRAIGGMDARYDDHGGGLANLDLYKRLLEAPDAALYLLFGEGTFHQFHGGITTNTGQDSRAAVMAAITAQDRAIRGDRTSAPGNVPILLGAAHPAMMKFLQLSLKHGAAR